MMRRWGDIWPMAQPPNAGSSNSDSPVDANRIGSAQMWRMLVLVHSLVWVGCGGCGSDVKPPGDQVMGTFRLHAKGTFAACSLPGMVAAYDFDGTFSRFLDGGRVFFTVDGVSYDGAFDGQIGSYGSTDARSFQLADGGSCSPCEMKVVQTGKVALLSKSQSKAVGDLCPPSPFDGGVPRDEDAGITLPSTTDAGFDAVLACGEMVVNILGEGFCDPSCYSCRLQYRLTGERLK